MTRGEPGPPTAPNESHDIVLAAIASVAIGPPPVKPAHLMRVNSLSTSLLNALYASTASLIWFSYSEERAVTSEFDI